MRRPLWFGPSVVRRVALSPPPPQRQEQASWVCQCDESVVQRLEQDFKVTLQQQSSLDQWATWLDNVVTQVLKPHQGSPSFPKAARQFLLKWSFYRYGGAAVRAAKQKYDKNDTTVS